MWKYLNLETYLDPRALHKGLWTHIITIHSPFMKKNIYSTQVNISGICPWWKLKTAKSQITWDNKLIKNREECLTFLHEKKNDWKMKRTWAIKERRKRCFTEMFIKMVTVLKFWYFRWLNFCICKFHFPGYLNSPLVSESVGYWVVPLSL